MSGPSYQVKETTIARKKDRKESTMEERDVEIESPPSGGRKSRGKGDQCGKRARWKKTGSEGGAPGKQPQATKTATTSASRLKDVAPCRQNSRSRRLVANARERSRIHILSDAFENLRRAVPSYSQDQKLSKLAILKLATYYISALANLAESDTSARSLKQFADCVAHCTKALQSEGRARRKQYDDPETI